MFVNRTLRQGQGLDLGSQHLGSKNLREALKVDLARQ